jgi:hypothetical protein
MSLQRTISVLLCLASLSFGAAGCTEATVYDGESLAGMTLTLYDADVGVHPSVSVLEDPNNPFATSVMGDQTKWNVQDSGQPVPAFYAWATVLARGPYGEAQFYVAKNLQAVFESGAASIDELALIRLQAIRAYQAVLDAFPGAVTYDVTGQIPYELTTPSYLAIVELGGTVSGGWILVTAADGSTKAVKQ